MSRVFPYEFKSNMPGLEPDTHAALMTNFSNGNKNLATKDYVSTETGLLIPKSVLTTRGDLLTRDASGVKRLPIGAAGSVLTSDGTDASWKTKAVGRMHLTSNTNINNHTDTLITGWTKDYETDPATVSVDTTNSRIIAKKAGFYRVSFYGAYVASGTTLQGYFGLMVNNAGTYTIAAYFTNVGGFYPSGCGASDAIQLSANDYVQMRTEWNFSGSGFHTLSGGTFCNNFFSVEYMGS